MKKLLLLLLLSLFIVSCQENKQQEIKSFYKKGDVVYIKPDSIRAVITYVNSSNLNGNTIYTYDIDFYVLDRRIQYSNVDSIYFYNNKKLKQ